MTVSERIEFIVLQRDLSDIVGVEHDILALWDRLDELWQQTLGDEVEYEREPVRMWIK